MNERFFLDSNILVYAYDRHDLVKQSRAQEILGRGISDDLGVLSGQVLGEFFVAVTRKIGHPMTTGEALEAVLLLGRLPVVEVDRRLVTSAIAIHQEHGISYWDGLILAAAARAGCSRVYSEDFNTGQHYGTVVVENPFVPAG